MGVSLGLSEQLCTRADKLVDCKVFGVIRSREDRAARGISLPESGLLGGSPQPPHNRTISIRLVCFPDGSQRHRSHSWEVVTKRFELHTPLPLPPHAV